MDEKEKLTQALQAKKENFEEWYPEVIQKAELIEYTKVSGCIIFRSNVYAIWENIMNYFNKKIKAYGVKNAYFPLFIPESLLRKEAEHVEGFTPEVAWVTQAGDTKLDERLAIRPTSETIMYDAFSKWINSWRDLPLKINQWANIVRWEFKHPKPLLRSREFLWQEGHTAFATKEEADADVRYALDLYKDVFENLLAIPVTQGVKTEKEKFAGADYTTTVEIMMPDGKVIQGGTSHSLGRHFSMPFNIKFLDKDGESKYVWQNSWGISTRSLGILISVHGDDKGLIIPPNVAPTQIVIVPIYTNENKEKVLGETKKLSDILSKKFSVYLDDRDSYTPGWKFNEWELKGVPLRIEIGPKDIEKKSVVFVRRDTGEKLSVEMKDIVKYAKNTLKAIQKNLFERAKKMTDEHTKHAKTFEELKKYVENNRVLVPWCGEEACENKVKEETGAKASCIPFKVKAEGNCFSCGKPAKHMVYFARSY